MNAEAFLYPHAPVFVMTDTVRSRRYELCRELDRFFPGRDTTKLVEWLPLSEAWELTWLHGKN